MTNTPHATITDPDIHEPKDCSTATSGQVYVADGLGSGVWTAFAAIPVGIVADYVGTTAPSGWLMCYGQAISRVTYAGLFAIIGTAYGSGDTVTTFNLPDCRGRGRVGKDNMGGSTAGRLTSAGSGIAGTTLGAVGGTESKTLTTTELPAHTHTYSGTTSFVSNDHTHTFGGSGSTGTFLTSSSLNKSTSGSASGGAARLDNNTSLSTNSGSNTVTISGTTSGISANHTHTYSGTTSSAGTGSAFGIMNPSIVFNVIIYTGV